MAQEKLEVSYRNITLYGVYQEWKEVKGEVLCYDISHANTGSDWSESEQASYIENLKRGFPMGTFIVSANYNKRGILEVIDGRNRLLALQKFFQDEIDGGWQNAHPDEKKSFLLNATMNVIFVVNTNEDMLRELYEVNHGTIRTEDNEMKM